MSNGRSFASAAGRLVVVAGVCLWQCNLAAESSEAIRFERHTLENGDAPISLQLAFRPDFGGAHPVILMLGALETNRVPAWSTNLVAEGFMLAAFTAAHPPDPDPRRRPVWLYFDERFAHSYALGAARAIADARRVIEQLVKRPDVNAEKIGWLGSSSTAIPGLAVVTQGPRLAAFVGFVCTGAYEQWFETWRENGMWRSGTNQLWPETRELLQRYDPIRHASNAFPTAVLMVSGGDDKVVDPRTARAFAEAARPFYQSDPERLRLLVYEGFGHNLPADVVAAHAEHWFRLYLNPTSAPPAAATATTNLAQSVIRSQINAASHRDLVAADTSAPRSLPWIVVNKSADGFAEAESGRKFTPWGFNYDRDYKLRLLEDYWDAEWPTIVEDFREMKDLGANVVRIHLQFAKFMESADQPNAASLQQLARLVKLAEATGLYLDLTGLGCYRQSDVPRWYDALSEPARWQAQARFWEAVADRCQHSPAIFCYDLINEPVVPGKPREAGDWLAGELAGFHYVQAITLDAGQRPRHEVARQWIEQLSAAIRKHDLRHLITVGLLPMRGTGFEPEHVSKSLDFVSVHIYPKSQELEAARKTLKQFATDKPLVVEEIFPMNCQPEELGRFIADSSGTVAGWLGFYWGQTPAELARDTSTGGRLTAQWLKLFQTINPNRPR